tara:strand:+ start:241 stop:486 length:246 start_codon:yes stop_codon:yes gene_type:complete
MIRAFEHLRLPVVLRDVCGECVEVVVEALIVGGNRGGKRGHRLVLGMDFWGRRDMRVCWDTGDDREWKGLVLGERKVEFGR